MGKTDPVTQFAEDVTSGKVVVCKYVRQACERHLRDLERKEFDWDLNAVKIAIGFSRLLRHYKGEFAGQLFEPQPWQQFLKGSIFGWKRKDGRRRFRWAYLEVPRKNGKTFSAADIGLHGLFADREPGAEIYSIATKRDQARIVWEDAKMMAARSPSLDRRSRAYTASLVVPSTASRFVPLAKDTKTMDGLNPHFAIGDEVHAWGDDYLFRQMNDAMGARRQPFFLMITTAGSNLRGICYRLREHVVAILSGNEGGEYIDDEFFGMIYTVDDGDDWRDRDIWFKANPNLGIAKSVQYMESQVKLAQQIPSEEFAVKNKQFNIWTETDTKWLDMDRWDKCAGKIDLRRLKGKPCHLGVDLSSVQDPTAIVALFPPGPYPEWVILPRIYLPEDRLALREREDRVPYPFWQKQSYLLTTPGDVIDLEFIKRDILQMAADYQVIDVGFDPWKAIEIATYLEGEGFDMVQMRQGHATLGAPTLELEKLVLQTKLRHAGHPVLRWMASNTAVIRDSNDNIRPDKKASRKRIDGIVATIMALGRALTRQDTGSPSAYLIDL